MTIVEEISARLGPAWTVRVSIHQDINQPVQLHATQQGCTISALVVLSVPEAVERLARDCAGADAVWSALLPALTRIAPGLHWRPAFTPRTYAAKDPTGPMTEGHSDAHGHLVTVRPVRTNKGHRIEATHADARGVAIGEGDTLEAACISALRSLQSHMHAVCMRMSWAYLGIASE